MKRVLILSDSLGLPRSFPEICKYEDTWPVLLKDSYLVHQVSLGGATTKELVGQIDYHESFNPDLVIVQVGIVDCAPRFLRRKEQALIRLFPFHKKIFEILNTPEFKRRRKITYTNINDFQNNIQLINDKFASKVVFLGILPSSNEYEKMLPGVSDNIKNYNNILAQNKYINLEDVPLNGIMSDYHHLNSFGHKIVFNKIKEFLNTFFY